MAHSREVRLPFLNHELVEFLLTLPPQMKINNAWTKWIMRQAFEKELPPEICWRKDKIGYEPPQKAWMEKGIMTERIGEAKNQLVGLGMVTNTTNKSLSELETISRNWKILMTAEMLS